MFYREVVKIINQTVPQTTIIIKKKSFLMKWKKIHVTL